MRPYFAEQEPGWCAWCGNALPEIRHWRAMFCDKVCANTYFNDLTAEARAEARATLACHGCGTPLHKAKRQDRRFCNEACRRRFAKSSAFSCDDADQSTGAAARAGRSCVECGVPINAKTATMRYCGNQCRQAAYRRRKGLKEAPLL